MKDGAFARDGPDAGHSPELRWCSSAINSRPGLSFPHAVTGKKRGDNSKEMEATGGKVLLVGSRGRSSAG